MHRNPATARRILNLCGFVAGFAVTVAAIFGSRVAPGSTAGADISITAPSTGELAVSPAGSILQRSNLKPSTRSRGVATRMTVRNQTAGELDVFVRAPARTRDLDRVLQVEIEAGGHALFAGRLAALRRWTLRSFRLASGTAKPLRIRAWIPSSRRSGWQAGVADITLQYRVQPAGARS